MLIVSLVGCGGSSSSSGESAGSSSSGSSAAQSTAWNKLVSGDYDICEMSIAMATSGDPETQLKNYFHSLTDEVQNYNHSGYSNEKVDALFDELKGTFDVDRRIEIIKEMEQIIMDDSAAIYFCYPLMNFVTKSTVTGITSHTSDYYWVSKDTGFVA